MNLYIIVEGDKTELSVYPAWLNILAPKLRRIENAEDVTDNCYYMFSGHGIPSIYRHACNAIFDIQTINKGYYRYDYLLLCLDTEEGTRQDIIDTLNDYLSSNHISTDGLSIVICEHQVCMESWFLGNSRIFRRNASRQQFIDCMANYDVSIDNPELMASYDTEKNKAEYHLYYLRQMFLERNMHYKKTETEEVQKPEYLAELVKRYHETGHIRTFGRWYDFITTNFG